VACKKFLVQNSGSKLLNCESHFEALLSTAQRSQWGEYMGQEKNSNTARKNEINGHPGKKTRKEK
jgi:hypothetical protein